MVHEQYVCSTCHALLWMYVTYIRLKRYTWGEVLSRKPQSGKITFSQVSYVSRGIFKSEINTTLLMKM